MDDRFFPGDPALTLVDKDDIPRGSQVTVEVFIRQGAVVRFKTGSYLARVDCWMCHLENSMELVPYMPSELMPLQPPSEPQEVVEFQGVVV